MADQDSDSTSDTSPVALPTGDAPVEEVLSGEAATGETPEEEPAETAAAGPGAEVPAEPEEEPEDEPVPSPFGAQFSSPEPTAVIARPRRRATRPAGAADPGAVEPLPPVTAPTIPAFVSFVAPEAEVAPAPRRRSRRPQAESPDVEDVRDVVVPVEDDEDTPAPRSRRGRSRRRGGSADRDADGPAADEQSVVDPDEDTADEDTGDEDAADDAERDETDRDETDREDGDGSGSRRRRRGRRGRGRGRNGDESADAEDDAERPSGDGAAEDRTADDEDDEDADTGEDAEGEDGAEGGSSTRRRRRRRRRGGEAAAESGTEDDDDRPERAGRNGRSTSDDDVRGVAGSTRLEAKRQRRREGRDTGRRRAPILTEAEFLARREAVERRMVIRQRGERTQIAVLEDGVLVEHYVTQAQATSFAGNVYLGRVQNVLPSMEAAFVDIGKGRNAVLYAGEVNWEAAGLSGKQRSIEQALKSGDKVLVQVTKDPIGHKGARLTQQVNLPGRFLVYVPGGSMTGISRKLPDTERQRLKDVLKKIVPEDAGVIIRTAAEGASEEELTRDVARLQAQWEVISQKAESSSNAPVLLYGEPDLAIRVIRDVFNEDFTELVVQGDDAWDTVEAYVAHVSPELSGRLTRHTGEGDVFRDLRVDEQLAKALDRKVWLPSGGSLVIDRTEAMTVVDVNTGKFTGSGGNLEQTVTRNNMEAAEEIVRQLRLRDIGGIIVIDFIDMVLESNRDLVLRRLTECLGRDRTKHQVAEVTSLGLVQMTRKRVGQGLLEVFSEPCEHCRGRGVLVHTDPVDDRRRGGNGSGGGSHGAGGQGSGNGGRRDQNGRKDADRSDRRDAERTEAEAVTPQTAAPDAGPESAPAGEAEGQRPGGSRRNRGRRNRGQSGEERAAEDAAVLAAASAVPDDTAPEDAAAGPAGAADDAAEVEVAVQFGSEVPGAEVTEPEETPAEGTQPEVTEPEETPAEEPAEEADPALLVTDVPALLETPSAEPPAPTLAAMAEHDSGSEPEVPAGAGPDDPAPASDPQAPESRAPESRAPESQAPEPPVAESQPPSADDGTGTAVGGARPRRRRAASRPAGPRPPDTRAAGTAFDPVPAARVRWSGCTAPDRTPVPRRRCGPSSTRRPRRGARRTLRGTDSSDRGVSGVRSREGRWPAAQGGRGRPVHGQPSRG
ncbi:ribonuclease E [Geodermatophilus normandii]|uniref:Ribonuclease E n=1 Tax=Geodermatophilus normandii TaxID=1137989 RepID=A0A317QQP1_9ACTN|nr:ribonuclease E/G [Geodermatophilus normandii]PWW25151.1 ribonuclease E [Geodermatophilus normandii]